MKLGKLNPRQCRAIVALADGPLVHAALEATIGEYATNTIKALATKGFIAAAGDAGVVQLTERGRAMALVLDPTKPPTPSSRERSASLRSGAHP